MHMVNKQCNMIHDQTCLSDPTHQTPSLEVTTSGEFFHIIQKISLKKYVYIGICVYYTHFCTNRNILYTYYSMSCFFIVAVQQCILEIFHILLLNFFNFIIFQW